MKQKSQKSLSWYKKKLWSVFSPWIKTRDGYTCFTCGRTCEGSGAHGGHFIKASVCGVVLYFDEDNVHCQCYHCNINLDGNQYEYGMRLGKRIVARLKRLRIESKGMKWTREQYQKKIDHYSALLGSGR